MTATFEEICSTIVTLTRGDKTRLTSDGLCATVRAVTGYVTTVSPTAQLNAHEKSDIREWLDERLALVLGNQSDRIERFRRLPMYRTAIEALDPPRIEPTAESLPDSGSYDRSIESSCISGTLGMT